MLRVDRNSVFTGWDFSTGAVKCLAFDIDGNVLAESRLPTDLWTQDGVSELNLLQLEGQARASTRAIAHALRKIGRLQDWAAGGISATHHTAGRIDIDQVQVRRAICWNDQSLMPFHAKGLKRLGGQKKVREFIGGPWAVRYSLSHLVKDEETLDAELWKRTDRMLPHGSLAAGFLTGNFNTASLSSAASTGLLDLRTGQWRREMLDAIADKDYRNLAWKQLPKIVDQFEPVGPLSESLALEIGLPDGVRPLIFPTSDDQQAGLVGGGAVDDGQLAIILGNSAVVNSSSNELPKTDTLDVMRLNWGPYLWMRCYTNGAQFLDKIVGLDPDWGQLEEEGRRTPPGADGTTVLPFVYAEPSIGVKAPRFGWHPKAPRKVGVKYRAALEALAYLIALGVRQHREGGQTIRRITVSGGIAKSGLMCEILASVLEQPVELLQSSEGPALGAAVTALAALENHRGNSKYTVAEAVGQMVKFRGSAKPNEEWAAVYRTKLREFEKLAGLLGRRK